MFLVDDNIKQEYLSTKITTTAGTDISVLKAADEYESQIGKPVYNMTYGELREMLTMQYKNSTVGVIRKNISVLKSYVDFCLEKNIVLHGENRLISVANDAETFINQHARKNRFVDREKMREYQNILANDQDKLILYLPYIGVGGKGLEEMLNLRLRNIDRANKMLTLTTNEGRHRRLEVDTFTIELIMTVYHQEAYLENNGEPTADTRLSKMKESKINFVEDYVLRIPGQKRYDQFTYALLNSRMYRYQKWFGNRYINYKAIRNSGMIQMAMDIVEKKGEITKEDYIDICDRFNFGVGDKYWRDVRSMFEQYRG